MDGPLPILYKLIGLTLDSNSQIYFTRYTLFMYLVSLINRILFYISHQSCKSAYNKSYQQNCRSSLPVHQTIYSQDDLINRILFYISHQSCKSAYNKSYQQNCRSSLQVHQTIYSQDVDQSSHIHKVLTGKRNIQNT